MILLLAAMTSPRAVWAGGSGLNVVVVVNGASSNSVALGNYFCEKRGVPPGNVLRVNWPGENILWTLDEFQAYLWNPLQTMLAVRGLTNQADYAVVSMDMPFRVHRAGGGVTGGLNSTTAALFYGFKPDAPPAMDPPGCSLPPGSSNRYAGSEDLFRKAYPATPGSVGLMAMMITGTNLALARQVIDRGVAGDGSFPTGKVVLGKSGDAFRNIRHFIFDDAIFNARLLGRPWLAAEESSGPKGLTNLFGYQNGLYRFEIDPGTLLPGAMADSLTSYGGLIFGPNDHTTLLEFLRAGASASYGTVVEPCAYLEKFPSPNSYFYQGRGFSIAEAYYQGVTNPYQGLLVGEPLSAPFALPGSGVWVSPGPNAEVSGTAELRAEFEAADPARPLSRVDLFVDGVWARTMTNIGPTAGNLVQLQVNGHTLDHTVPAEATEGSLASGLAAALNAPAFRDLSRVSAEAHGDRVELRSEDLGKPAAEVALAASTSTGAGSALTTFARATGSALLETQARGVRTFTVDKDPALGDYLDLAVTLTNGLAVRVAVTNQAAGTKVGALVTTLMSLVNGHPALEAEDGVNASDLVDQGPFGVAHAEFSLRPNSIGWAAAQIRATLIGSGMTVAPFGERRLDENASFLKPRAHVYMASGVTNLAAASSLDTTSLADGWHELTAVAYEGTHVRTQCRASRWVKVRNGTLSATITDLNGGTNLLDDATVQFAVAANRAEIASIELFSTGGAVSNAVAMASVVFATPGPQMGPGLHPFYAMVTADNGERYRTETAWIRLVAPADEEPFKVTVEGWPPGLTWPAVVGQSYTVQSTDSLGEPFLDRGTVIGTNSVATWVDTTSPTMGRFYRVRSGE